MTELHLHLDGSLRAKTCLDLYHEQNIKAPTEDVLEMKRLLTASENCKNLEEVLRCFNIPLVILQEKYALERVAYELTEDLYRSGDDYCEIRFAPNLSLQHGLTQEEVLEAVMKGVERGMKEYPIRIGLILCIMRGQSEENNMKTVEVCNKYHGNIVCGLDLAGAENIFPAKLYRPVFKKAKEYGLPFTMHAGESLDPNNVMDAIDMGARRLGHGITVVKHPELLKAVKEKNVHIECCLTSNIQTKEVESLSVHPLRKLFDEGVSVSINTDNLSVSDSNHEKEIQLAKKYLGFTDLELDELERRAKEARFLK